MNRLFNLFKYNLNFKLNAKLFRLYPYISRIRFLLVSIIPSKKRWVAMKGFKLLLNTIDHPSRTLWSYRDNYELDTINLIKSIIKKEDVAVDIGANVGYFSYILNKAVGPKGKVYSFEPNSEIYDCLEINLRNFKSAKIFKAYVADREKTIEYSSPNLWDKNLEIQTVTINNVVKENIINFIKIDIDGIDFLALKGCSNWLKASKQPKIIIEISKNSDIEHGIHYDEIFSYLVSLGYRAFNASLPLTEFNKSDIKKYNVINVLFLPPNNFH